MSDGLGALGKIAGGLARSIPGLGTALNLADVAGMTLGALGITGGAKAKQGRLPGFGGGRGGGGRRRKRVSLPKKMPTHVQWKRINKRLHEYRKVAIGVIGRTGGMHQRRRHYGGRRRYMRGRR